MWAYHNKKQFDWISLVGMKMVFEWVHYLNVTFNKLISSIGISISAFQLRLLSWAATPHRILQILFAHWNLANY